MATIWLHFFTALGKYILLRW